MVSEGFQRGLKPSVVSEGFQRGLVRGFRRVSEGSETVGIYSRERLRRVPFKNLLWYSSAHHHQLIIISSSSLAHHHFIIISSGKTRVECQKLRVFCVFGVPESVLRIVLTTRFATYGRLVSDYSEIHLF